MPFSVRLGRLFALACIAAMFGCSGDVPALSPSSLTPPAAPRATLSVRPSDYHEDPMPMPDPAPAPAPDPGPAPAPGPSALTISIVGSFGSAAFMPNPIQAVVGNTIVWTNNDATLHRIVLDDGTAVGNLAPGQSSTPIALTKASASYHCTIHPSMVGSFQDPSAPAPAPPPVYEPPPDDGYYDY